MLIIQFLNKLEYLDRDQIAFNSRLWNIFGYEMLSLREYSEIVFYLDTVYLNQHIYMFKQRAVLFSFQSWVETKTKAM